MRRLVYSSAAQRDLRGIAAFIALQSGAPDIGGTFVASIRAKCKRLADLPGTLGTARPDLADNLRSTPHKGYVIYFRYLGDMLEILSVLDARRDVVACFAPDEGG